MTRGKHSKSAKKDWWESMAKKHEGLRLCDRCNAVYYDGHWHTNPRFASLIREHRPNAKKELCRQCAYIVNGDVNTRHGFEGLVVLDGLRDPDEKHEILLTVRNFARKATDRDPEDQIADIDDRGERVVISTTDNQMAVGIGKAVDKSFKGGDLRIVWSKDDMPARVYWKHKS